MGMHLTNKCHCLQRTSLPKKQIQGHTSVCYVTIPSWSLPALCYDSLFPSCSAAWLSVNPSLWAWHQVRCQIPGSFHWSVTCCSFSHLSLCPSLVFSFMPPSHFRPHTVPSFSSVLGKDHIDHPPLKAARLVLSVWTWQDKVCLDPLKPRWLARSTIP